MTTPFIVFLIISAVAVLLLMVLKFKISAFISLLITSIYVGIAAGMPLKEITLAIQNGMAGTLGFVATVVGLGAIFGQMLESSGGAESLARYLIKKFGTDKASWAMVITGFVVAIPVFLDVGFIILVPIIYALARDTKRSLLYYGNPLLAGLAVTHSFIPPTPGPVAVADIINAQLGWVILFGVILGFPTAVIAGPVWGKYISKKIYIEPPAEINLPQSKDYDENHLPSFRSIALIVAIPLLLILVNTFTGLAVTKQIVPRSVFTDILEFIGHPFSALIIATLIAIYFLCIKRGMGKQKILDLSTKALGPAGIIILITGAGGVLKQILVDSGIGKMMAESMAGSALPPILLAWMLAAVVRVTQGSATVAMITAAESSPRTRRVCAQRSAARAGGFIHRFGGYFALACERQRVLAGGKYLGMNEKQTLQSWTVMETIIAFCGLALTLLASLFF
jgi:Gnt-I system low-affinity gluconate transporter